MADADAAAAAAEQEQEAEAEEAVSAVLGAMREPGFRTACVDGLLGAECGLLFVECPLAALRTTARLLPLTADRPPEQRFRPLLGRARGVATSDAHLALGLASGDRAAGRVASLAQTQRRDLGFVALLSVALSPGRSLAFAARFTFPDNAAAGGDGLAEMAREPAPVPCRPSLWAAEPKPASQQPQASAQPGTGPGEWLFVTHRGKDRAKARPSFQWTGRLRCAVLGGGCPARCR